MTKSETTTDLSFNAWTDAWLPLVQESGETVWASPVEVLCGEKDGLDLDYPRDDFRVYARLLLSALVQALFPAKNKAELLERLETPLSRAVVEKRLKPVTGDFDLFGPTPFLQVTPPAKPPDKGASAFVFVGEDLYQPSVPVDAVSLPVAVVMLFIEQAYAGGAGRGYGAGPGGQPGAFTMIDAGSVRRTTWANTLATDLVRRNYAAEDEHPWSNEKGTARPRASTAHGHVRRRRLDRAPHARGGEPSFAQDTLAPPTGLPTQLGVNRGVRGSDQRAVRAPGSPRTWG